MKFELLDVEKTQNFNLTKQKFKSKFKLFKRIVLVVLQHLLHFKALVSTSVVFN